MRVPSVPHVKFFDADGEIHTAWRTYFDLLTTHLQNNFAQFGTQLANYSTDVVQPLANSQTSGRLLYDADKETPVINQSVPVTTDGVISQGFRYRELNTYHEMTNDELQAVPSGERNGKLVYNTTNDTVHIGVNNEFREVSTT